MERYSQVQGGCYWKWIGGTLQICKILKPGKKFSNWRETSYQRHYCPGAQSFVIYNDFILFFLDLRKMGVAVATTGMLMI